MPICYNFVMNTAIEEQKLIRELLPMLPDEALNEVKDFISYLIDRERRRKSLEKRVLKAEKETPVRLTAEQAMKAIRNEAKS